MEKSDFFHTFCITNFYSLLYLGRIYNDCIMSTYMVDTLHIYIIIYTLRNKKLKISHTFEKKLSLVFFDPKNF